MTEKLQQVAQAIGNALTDKDGYLRKSYSDEDLAEIAGAAMQAMLEPTDTMIRYGWKKSNNAQEWEVAKIWRGMVYAALGKFYKPPE